MNMYITEEQMNTIDEVNNKYPNEMDEWCETNVEELMKWFNNDGDMLIERRIQRFGYYCANKFLEQKDSNMQVED